MNEMAFDSTDQLHGHLSSKGGANPQSHGGLGQFYAAMSMYKDPNTCGCKKGKRAVDAINTLYGGLGSTPPSVKEVFFGNATVILRLNGAEVARF